MEFDKIRWPCPWNSDQNSARVGVVVGLEQAGVMGWGVQGVMEWGTRGLRGGV